MWTNIIIQWLKLFNIEIRTCPLVADISISNANYVTFRGDVYVEETGRRVIQRLLFISQVYNIGRPLLDNVLMKTVKLQQEQSTRVINNISTIDIWLWNSIYFLKSVPEAFPRPVSMRFTYNTQIVSYICGKQTKWQFVLAQFYMLKGRDEFSSHNLDDTLDCILFS